VSLEFDFPVTPREQKGKAFVHEVGSQLWSDLTEKQQVFFF